MGLIEQYIPKEPKEKKGGLIEQYMAAPIDLTTPVGELSAFEPAKTEQEKLQEKIAELGPSAPARPSALTQALWLPYRPVGAYLKSSVESLQKGMLPTQDPNFGVKYLENLTGNIEDISGKAISEPVAEAVLRGLPDDVGTPLGMLYYGSLVGGKPSLERISTGFLKTAALRGDLGPLRPEDIPAQTSPAGAINMLIESLGLDWFIPAGAVAKPFGSAARAMGKTLFRVAPFTERIAGAFSRHLGVGAPVNQIADEFTRKMTSGKARIGFGEAKVRKTTLDVLKKYDIDPKKADPLFDEIIETFKPGKEAIETPPFFTGELAEKFMAPPSRSVGMMVKQALPEITSAADIRKAGSAIEHYIHIGKQGIDLERSAGIPIKQLGGDTNYLLHYLSDEAREIGPALRRTAPRVSGKEEARLVKDIFHPSLLKRQFNITIKEGNELAAAGRVYVKGGKIGLLDEGKALPKGAKAIPKLFEDDPMRLAVIRQVRTARAVTTKQFLDDVWDTLPDYEGAGGVTLFSKLGKKKWEETFALMGEAAEKYKNKLLEPEVARTVMFGVQRMHDFRIGTKHPVLGVYDSILNWWKPLQLYFYPKYHTRNFGTAQWNEFLNDNLLGMMEGHAEILGSGRLIKHPLFEEMVEWGVLGRSQFTADIERGLAFGTNKFGVHKLGEWLENFIRGSSYIGWRNKGLSPRLATRKVMQSQFDYLDLTWFEWNVMRRFLPFYTFSRKNVPFQVSRLLDKPAKGLAPLRSVLGQEPDWEKYETSLLPPQVKDRFPVKVGDNTYLALEDSWAMFDIGKMNPTGGKLAEEFVQMLSPFLKMPIEQYARTVEGRWTGWGPKGFGVGPGEVTGYSLFTQRPIAPWWKPEADLWGQPLPVKLVHNLKNTFRFFREVEKSPWYPEDEGKPLGQSKFAKALQFWGVPYYESQPQQQIHHAIKDLKRQQDDMGGLKPGTAERYKDISFEIIALRSFQDQMLEPFRGGKRIVHSEDAVLDELSNMTGVDMKAIHTKHGDKWREAAMYAPNVLVDFARLRKEFPGKTEDELRAEAFGILEREAKSVVFFRGGVENFSDTITTITNLLYYDDQAETFKRTRLLDEDERTTLRGVLIGTLMSGVEYLDENRRSGGSEWYEYADRVEEWSKFIFERTGKTPPQIQKAYQGVAAENYAKLKAQYPKPSKEGFDKFIGSARKYATDVYLSRESKDYWWNEYETNLTGKYDWYLSDGKFSKFGGGTQLANAITNDMLPIDMRRRLGRYYAINMKTMIDGGVKTKASWKWVEENIVPLFR